MAGRLQVRSARGMALGAVLLLAACDVPGDEFVVISDDAGIVQVQPVAARDTVALSQRADGSPCPVGAAVLYRGAGYCLPGGGL